MAATAEELIAGWSSFGAYVAVAIPSARHFYVKKRQDEIEKRVREFQRNVRNGPLTPQVMRHLEDSAAYLSDAGMNAALGLIWVVSLPVMWIIRPAPLTDTQLRMRQVEQQQKLDAMEKQLDQEIARNKKLLG